MTEPTYDPESHYDRVTEAWTLLLGDDLHYGVFSTGSEDLPTATRELTNVMVTAAQIEPGVEVLDVGCGTGAPACQLAKEHAARVTGITTSSIGVAAARARAAATGLEDLVVVDRRDGVRNEYADESFDRVWVQESSHLVRDREGLMAECARVLRRDGRLALCDIMLRRAMPFEEVRRLREPLGLLRRVFGDARMEALDRYAELARANGLIVQREVDLTVATRPTFARWRARAIEHRDRVVESLGEADWQRFVDACTLLEAMWDDGTLGYGLLAASKP